MRPPRNEPKLNCWQVRQSSQSAIQSSCPQCCLDSCSNRGMFFSVCRRPGNTQSNRVGTGEGPSLAVSYAGPFTSWGHVQENSFPPLAACWGDGTTKKRISLGMQSFPAHGKALSKLLYTPSTPRRAEGLVASDLCLAVIGQPPRWLLSRRDTSAQHGPAFPLRALHPCTDPFRDCLAALSDAQ